MRYITLNNTSVHVHDREIHIIFVIDFFFISKSYSDSSLRYGILHGNKKHPGEVCWTQAYLYFMVKFKNFDAKWMRRHVKCVCKSVNIFWALVLRKNERICLYNYIFSVTETLQLGPYPRINYMHFFHGPKCKFLITVLNCTLRPCIDVKQTLHTYSMLLLPTYFQSVFGESVSCDTLFFGGIMLFLFCSHWSGIR